jgi:Gas vesicle protein G
MGLFTGLLTLPLAPVRGVVWVAELLAEEAERELAEANSPQRALAELEAARATGELTDEQFEQLEAQLLDEIFAAREGRST